MFFLQVTVRPGVPFRTVFSRWGLDAPAQARALALPENGRLRARIRGPVSPEQSLPVRVRGRPVAVHLMVPIEIELTTTRYLQRVDLVHGLLPREVGATGPPVLTHGMDVQIERNLGPATGLRWIQTTTRLNDHTHAGRLTEFVDGAINHAPWVFPRGPQEVFTDRPAAPVPRPGAPAIDFEATATVAVLFGSHIILAAGRTWGFTVNRGPSGIVPKPSRAATSVDFRKQLRILRAGLNVFGDPTGAGLGYELPPGNGRVVAPRARRP